MRRRTVDAYICDGRSRADRGERCGDRSSGNVGNFDVDRRNVCAAERELHGMAPRIARQGSHFRVVFVAARHVIIRVRPPGGVMLV